MDGIQTLDTGPCTFSIATHLVQSRPKEPGLVGMSSLMLKTIKEQIAEQELLENNGRATYTFKRNPPQA